METLVKINDVKFDQQLFDAWKTNSPIDGLFSIKGGIPKATNWMVVGDPGVGKSTVTLDILANCKASGAKVLFISAEMNQVDLYLYVERYPKFGEIEIFFPQEMMDGCPKEELSSILNRGWDLVLIDSFVEVQEILKEECSMSTKASEKWLLDLMYRHNMAKNPAGVHTSFLNIQQVTKGGQFVGSNRLKHMQTGMMEIRFTEDEEERYCVFSKNRRGHVGKIMYFTLATSGDVNYDFNRFQKNEELQELKAKEKAKMKDDEALFNQLFGFAESAEEGAE